MNKLMITSSILCVFLRLFSIGYAQETPELVLPIGHSAPITSVAFSPDDEYVVSASEDTTIRLWERKTGREIRSFLGHQYSIYSIVFSPDGRYLISSHCAGRGSHLPTGNNIKIWEIKTGKQIFYISGQKGVYSVDISSDGKYILSGSYCVMNLWDSNTGKELMSFLGHNHIVTSVSFSPNGLYALSASYDKTIKLWNIHTGKEIRSFSTIGNKSPIWSASFSPDGKYVVAGISDKVIKLWAIHSEKEIKTFSGYTGIVYAIKFSPDGRYVAAGCSDNTVKVWEVSSGKQTFSLQHDGSVLAVAFSKDGRYLLSGSEDKTMKLWDFSTAKEICTYKGYSRGVSSNAFSPDGKFVATVLGDVWTNLGNKDFIVWDFESGRIIHSFSGHKGNVWAVAFSPNNNRFVASASQDRTIKLWDVIEGREVRTFSGSLSRHRGEVLSIAFSPDGKYILSGSSDKTAKIWDVESGANVKTFLFKSAIYSVAFSKDGSYLAIGSEELAIFETKNWEKIKSIRSIKEYDDKGKPGYVYILSFHKNNNYILAGYSTGVAKIFDINSGTEVAKCLHSGWITGGAFSPDGKYAVTISRDEPFIRVWEISTSKIVKEIKSNAVFKNNSITFSADGKYILVGKISEDNSLYNFDTSELVLTYFFANKSDWVVSTMDGRFDGSSEGIKLLYYVKNNKSIPFDSLFDRFYTPNLVANVLYGREFVPQPLIEKIQMPPLVRIISPEDGQILNQRDIEVVIEATDQGGGIEDIRLFHNDKRIIGDESDNKGMKQIHKIQKKFSITLVSGINTLKATAFSKDRTESNPYMIKIKVDLAKATFDMFIVAVGINSYKNSNYNLRYCISDAQAMVTILSEKGKSIFRNIRLQTIFDEQATRAGIESALKRVEREARPEDVFIFYYSGHGAMDEDNMDFYFVLYDVTNIYGKNILKEKGLSATYLRDMSQSIKATKQLIIIDSCQSGKLTDQFKGVSEEKAIAQLAKSAGITVISAAQSEQFALEYKEIKHGLFTYALLQGIEGKADGSPKDNRITVNELSAYIQAVVPELTRKYRGKPQYPNVYMRGQDFPIVMKR